MPLFLKKSLIKWSAISLIGVSAYFLGFFWGAEKLAEQASRETASVEAPQVELQQPSELRHLKERVH